MRIQPTASLRVSGAGEARTAATTLPNTPRHDFAGAREKIARTLFRQAHTVPPAMDSNNTGRPTLLTPEVHAEIVKLVGLLGVLVEDAAEECRVSRSVLYDWLDRGRRERSGPYHDLVVDVMQARAHRKIGLAALVMAGAEHDPRLAFSYLKYMSQEGRRTRRKKSKAKTRPTHVAAEIRDALKAMDESAPGPSGSATAEDSTETSNEA
jgi:hypothetical protein